MKKEELEAFLTRKGFKKDRYGNYKKPDDPDKRWKMQATSVRFETKLSHGWQKIYGDYYKNLEITKENKIRKIKT